MRYVSLYYGLCLFLCVSGCMCWPLCVQMHAYIHIFSSMGNSGYTCGCLFTCMIVSVYVCLHACIQRKDVRGYSMCMLLVCFFAQGLQMFLSVSVLLCKHVFFCFRWVSVLFIHLETACVWRCSSTNSIPVCLCTYTSPILSYVLSEIHYVVHVNEYRSWKELFFYGISTYFY